MNILIRFIVILLFLNGCSGSKLQADLWEQQGALRIAEPDNPSYDYKFYIRTGIDFGVNTKIKEDRLLLIQSKLKNVCKSIQSIDETFLPTESKNNGDSKGTYVMKIKCINY